MISLSEIRMIALSEVPYGKGNIYLKGLRFSEDNTKYSIVYDVNAVPHIWYQEKGFKHYKSGKFITVNQWFIRDRTVNALTSYAIEPSTNIRSGIMDNNKRTVQARTSKLSQGTIQSIKGNENR